MPRKKNLGRRPLTEKDALKESVYDDMIEDTERNLRRLNLVLDGIQKRIETEETVLDELKSRRPNGKGAT